MKRLQITQKTCVRKILVHEIAAINLLKIYSKTQRKHVNQTTAI